MWTRIYGVIGSFMLIGYSVAAWTGWEIGTLDTESKSQAASRHAAGGHRSQSFWFFRGGK